MFDNIGGKIKTLAKVICWLGIIAFCIFAIVSCRNDRAIAGILTGILGSLLSWISSFMLYGYGELIDTNQKILEELKRQ